MIARDDDLRRLIKQLSSSDLSKRIESINYFRSLSEPEARAVVEYLERPLKRMTIPAVIALFIVAIGWIPAVVIWGKNIPNWFGIIWGTSMAFILLVTIGSRLFRNHCRVCVFLNTPAIIGLLLGVYDHHVPIPTEIYQALAEQIYSTRGELTLSKTDQSALVRRVIHHLHMGDRAEPPEVLAQAVLKHGDNFLPATEMTALHKAAAHRTT